MIQRGGENDCVIRALAPDLLPDYLRFFDHVAFCDNPRWASCYCHFSYARHAEKKWAERTAGENRAAVGDLIASGQMAGYLAYMQGEPVAWCNAARRGLFTTLEADPEVDNDRTGAIVCFIVAPAHRRQGLAKRLLAAACDGFRDSGFNLIEAYPRREAGNDAGNYHGPLSMYLSAGFEPVREGSGVVTVRKELA